MRGSAPNSVAFDQDKYKTKDCMWDNIFRLVRSLCDAGCISTVRYEDAGIYVVDFSSDDKSFGAEYPYWLTPEEIESVIFEGDEVSSDDGEEQYEMRCGEGEGDEQDAGL